MTAQLSEVGDTAPSNVSLLLPGCETYSKSHPPWAYPQRTGLVGPSPLQPRRPLVDLALASAPSSPS